jgi:hypothetical protein
VTCLCDFVDVGLCPVTLCNRYARVGAYFIHVLVEFSLPLGLSVVYLEITSFLSYDVYYWLLLFSIWLFFCPRYKDPLSIGCIHWTGQHA